MMHPDDNRQQPRQTSERKGARAAGGVLVALGIAAAKFKTIVALLFSFKWLVLAPKLLLSVGSMFLSVWLYALWFGGWKIGIVFVLMILVHELGHFFTWRNYGVKASLPTFIPGLGAFVSAPPTGTPAQNAAAALAGPLFGCAAAAVCWAYGTATHEPFWIVAAYIGFFINLFNLIPLPPFDGGAIAAAIDARLWLVGVAAFAAYVLFFAHFSGFGVLILILVAVSAFPRIMGLWQGRIDPRGSGLTTPQRTLAALAYFALIGLAVAGSAATHIARPA